MSSWRFGLIAAVGFWLSAGLHSTLALRLAGSPFAPNLIVAFVASLSLWTSRAGGLGLGFVAGVIEGTLAGANMVPYVVARMSLGLIGSIVGAQSSDRGAPNAMVVAAGGGLLSGLILLFLAPPRGIGAYLLALVAGAIVTGLLAGPIALLVGKVSGGRRGGYDGFGSD